MIAVTSNITVVPTVAVVDIATHTAHPIYDTIGTGPVAYGGDDDVATDDELISAASTARPVPIPRGPRMTVETIAFDPVGGLMAVGGSWLGGSGGQVLLLDTSTRAAARHHHTGGRGISKPHPVPV